ncbi:hypothetical protein EG329_001928 [Mollisiaceae sp. DMI_Dod_QoI]|nr:hypothetical protein EG329_001928 [Helotiales sp. DMI_Dod_QoI]
MAARLSAQMEFLLERAKTSKRGSGNIKIFLNASSASKQELNFDPHPKQFSSAKQNPKSTDVISSSSTLKPQQVHLSRIAQIIPGAQLEAVQPSNQFSSPISSHNALPDNPGHALASHLSPSVRFSASTHQPYQEISTANIPKGAIIFRAENAYPMVCGPKKKFPRSIQRDLPLVLIQFGRFSERDNDGNVKVILPVWVTVNSDLRRLINFSDDELRSELNAAERGLRAYHSLDGTETGTDIPNQSVVIDTDLDPILADLVGAEAEVQLYGRKRDIVIIVPRGMRESPRHHHLDHIPVQVANYRVE